MHLHFNEQIKVCDLSLSVCDLSWSENEFGSRLNQIKTYSNKPGFVAFE